MEDEVHHRLQKVLRDSMYVPKWVSKYATNNKHVDIVHECFHIRIYANKLNATFVKNLKKLLTELRNILRITNERINMFLLLSGKKKRINVGQIFKSENINSGLSISTLDPEAVHIVIYRLEDIFKVVIHEIIHYVRLDLHHVHDSIIHTIDDMIKTKYKSMLHTDLYINEAYTEALAIYYYCILMNKDLKLEQEHSIKQTKMFLLVNGCDTLQSFKMKQNYHEDSHPYAYILLKSALLNCKYFMQNIELLYTDVVMLNNSFKKAISNIIWIRKVDEYKIDKRITKFNMNLTYV